MPKQKPLMFLIHLPDIQQLLFRHYPSIIPKTEDISSNFDDEQVSHLNKESVLIPVEHIINKEPNTHIYDPHKRQTKLWLTMCPKNNDSNLLPEYTNKPCWYDHHSFISSPIGCPLSYDSSTNTFYTEGIFCSFPCVKSYIKNEIQKGRIELASSLTLLTMMYKMVYDDTANRAGSSLVVTEKTELFPLANSIQVIDRYNGHLNIDEWRSSVGSVNYNILPNTRYERIKQSPTVTYYTETVSGDYK